MDDPSHSIGKVLPTALGCVQTPESAIDNDR